MLGEFYVPPTPDAQFCCGKLGEGGDNSLLKVELYPKISQIDVPNSYMQKKSGFCALFKCPVGDMPIGYLGAKQMKFICCICLTFPAKNGRDDCVEWIVFFKHGR